MMPRAVVIGTLPTCQSGIVMQLSQIRQGFAGCFGQAEEMDVDVLVTEPSGRCPLGSTVMQSAYRVSGRNRSESSTR
jgi:hypothetical protein